jgi:hypothetical protein
VDTEPAAKSKDGPAGVAFRTFFIRLNLGIAIAFALFFIATFAMPKFVRNLARDYAVEKTVAYAQPKFEKLSAHLQSQAEKNQLRVEMPKALSDEIDQFTHDPKSYILALADAETAVPEPDAGRSLTDVIGNFSNAPVVTFQQEIRAYYFSTVAALLGDLRIFAGTNVIAALIGMLAAYYARRNLLVPLLLVSILLLMALFFCMVMYLRSMTFFSILTHRHYGMAYPFAVVVTSLYLVIRTFMSLATHGLMSLPERA